MRWAWVAVLVGLLVVACAVSPPAGDPVDVGESLGRGVRGVVEPSGSAGGVGEWVYWIGSFLAGAASGWLGRGRKLRR